MKIILDSTQLQLTIKRLSHEILERHTTMQNVAIIGIQPRGIYLGKNIFAELTQNLQQDKVLYGNLDITFYRDDIRKNLHVANKTDIPFSIEGKKVVMIDDVLWTGRTIRAALDALLGFGRPETVELCVLINRRFGRELPIQADYIGKSIDTFDSQKVKVFWQEKDGKNEVVLLEQENLSHLPEDD